MSELMFLTEVALPVLALAVLCVAAWWLYRAQGGWMLASACIAFAIAAVCAFLLAITPIQVTFGVTVDDIAMKGAGALWLLAASRIGGALALFTGAALLAASALGLRNTDGRA